MNTKVLVFSLSLAVAGLAVVGCGRSKPPPSKAATTDALAEDPALSHPPQVAADETPVIPPPPPVIPPPPSNSQVSFAPLPRGTGADPAGDAEVQKIRDIRAKQRAAASARAAQNPPPDQSAKQNDQ